MIALGCSKTVRNGIIGLTKLLGKIKFLKKPIEKALPSLIEYCDNAQIGFKHIASDIPTFLKAFLVKLITMIVYYSIPFFLMLSVGMRFSSFYEFILVFFGGPFAITSVVFMPTPGGTLGIEYAFAIVIAAIFAGNFSRSDASGVTLLWRLLTFYMLMLFSFVFSAWFEKMYSKQEKLKDKADGIEKRLKEENRPPAIRSLFVLERIPTFATHRALLPCIWTVLKQKI